MTHPLVLGLTGGIGMGKTTTATSLRRRGIPVLDSDAVSGHGGGGSVARLHADDHRRPVQVVHDLYSPGGAAVTPVAEAFPGVVVDGAVSRPLLSTRVMGAPEALRALEAVVHPLVQQEKRRFLRNAVDTSQALVVLDIPLLYETGAEAQCDAVAVVSAPAEVQRARALARPGMTPDKLDSILQRQMPDAEKRRRADFVIDTGTSIVETERQLEAMLAALHGRQGTACAALLGGD